MAKKTQINPDFRISLDMRAWAAEKVPGMDIDHYHDEFIDHWLGNGKPMANWVATWRNWMRRTFSGEFRNAPLRRVRPSVRPSSKNVVNFPLQNAARAHGIDPSGMSDDELNQAIYDADRARRST